MTLKELKSQVFFEDSGHTFYTFYCFLNNLCIFCHNIVLMLLNHFLRNEGRSSQKPDFFWETVGTVFAVFVFLSTSFPIILVIIVWRQSIIFSKMEPETLKSELLLEDSGYSICCLCSSFNIFSNHFDPYCLTSINHFLRNGARRFQKRIFVQRQWAQNLLFFSACNIFPNQFDH